MIVFICAPTESTQQIHLLSLLMYSKQCFQTLNMIHNSILFNNLKEIQSARTGQKVVQIRKTISRRNNTEIAEAVCCPSNVMITI